MSSPDMLPVHTSASLTVFIQGSRGCSHAPASTARVMNPPRIRPIAQPAMDDSITKRTRWASLTSFTALRYRPLVQQRRDLLNRPPEYDESDDVLDAPELPRATQPRHAGSRSNQGSVLTIALPGGAAAELRLPDRLTPDALKAVVDWLGTAPQVPEAPDESESSPTPDPDASGPLLLSGQSADAAQD